MSTEIASSKSAPSKLKAKAPELTKPGKTKVLIYGAPGVGKTWFALSFPSVYYYDTEGGADLAHYQKRLKESGGVYMGPGDGTLNFQTLLDQMQALATEKHPYKTLVIDSITKLFQTQIAETAEQILAKGNKDEFGASKRPAVGMMRRFVNWASRIDMNVIVIAHETTEYGLVSNQRQEIGKMADCWDKLAYELHLALHATKRGPQRMAQVKKSRLTGFGEGDSLPLDYGEYAARYGKDFIEAAVAPLTLASAEQVAEINRLLELAKIPDEEIAKWHSKAQTSSFAEMDAATISKVIDFVKAKLK